MRGCLCNTLEAIHIDFGKMWRMNHIPDVVLVGLAINTGDAHMFKRVELGIQAIIRIHVIHVVLVTFNMGLMCFQDARRVVINRKWRTNNYLDIVVHPTIGEYLSPGFFYVLVLYRRESGWSPAWLAHDSLLQGMCRFRP